MARIQTAKSRKIIDSVSDVQIRNAVRDRVLYLMAEKCGYISVGKPPVVDDILMVIDGYDKSEGIIFDDILLSVLDRMYLSDIDKYLFSDRLTEIGG